ncbi:MAG: D-erythronate dehydrogenase [Casimicrobiaceae bacterium]
MRIVITGGAGFLGNRLAQAILTRGRLTDATGREREVRTVVLVDVAAPRVWSDERIETVGGDLADPALLGKVITSDTDSVFHLAAVVSGQAEADFDIGMKVNLDVTRGLLEHCRACASPPRFVFTSSLAVFGGNLPSPVPDHSALTPQSSYGTQKAIGELLVYDMSRKGFIDGRSLRLPTVTVRPGKPNKAASSFASGIIREPLAGVEAICPVGRDTRMWVQSPQSVIDNLLVGHEVPADRFTHSRSINVPGITVAVGDMVDALRRVAGDEVAARVRWEFDPAIDRIVSTWPAVFAPKFGESLGMRADESFERIVRAYCDDVAAGR